MAEGSMNHYELFHLRNLGDVGAWISFDDFELYALIKMNQYFILFFQIIGKVSEGFPKVKNNIFSTPWILSNNYQIFG